MNLLKRAILNLPVLQKTQVCEGCDDSFACEISLGKGCWCGEVKLSEDTHRELRAIYRNCLCRTCLEKAEAKTQSREAGEFND
jgi:hypothetical protein